ncbi:MAG: ABATE domain-containing protein [Actinomycetota bacterium]|nr:ABATE domain-containing protein [Actinomycetota bacterium]
MIQVTWEWLGQGLALDLADTVTIENGIEHDLIEGRAGYARWAELEAPFVPQGPVELLLRARPELLDLRTTVRAVLAAVSAGRPVPRKATSALNAASACAPSWLELDARSGATRQATSGSEVDALVAAYARSAIELVARDAARLSRCPAPSCGMFYLRARTQQRWCSTQCGSRARVARHYKRHRAET